MIGRTASFRSPRSATTKWGVTKVQVSLLRPGTSNRWERPHYGASFIKVHGRKRHVMAGADGVPLVPQAYPASIQDLDGAAQLLGPPFVEISSPPTRREYDWPVSVPSVPPLPTSPCWGPGRKQTSLASCGRPLACRGTVGVRPMIRHVLAGRQ
jgi:hypothetical protein